MKCKVSKICGGCSYLNLSKEEQAQKKKQAVSELIDRYHLKLKVNDIYMAEQDLQYRNKVIVGFAKEKGIIYSGLYAAKSHRVCHSENCFMHPEIINEIIKDITKMMQSMKIELYNERTGTGLLRHVLIRYAHKTDEIMIVFVTSQKMFPSRKNIVKALTSKYPQIKTIVQNINPRRTSIVLQDESIVLYGKGYITDELCGLKISFSFDSFYQIHSQQCEVLYKLAKIKLHLSPEETVLDTYCGTGTIGLTLADSCKKVTGVERNGEAINFARQNAKQNNIDNIQFVQMDSTQFMKEAKKYHTHYDAIILDPPRAGTTKEFIENACALEPKKILYISCDPNTLMRDLVQFRKQGYVSNKVDLVDMFPRTEHVESVVLLSKMKTPANNRHLNSTKYKKKH